MESIPFAGRPSDPHVTRWRRRDAERNRCGSIAPDGQNFQGGATLKLAGVMQNLLVSSETFRENL
ncbi:hypothetical protein [Croceicoccus sp. YJ47]|uniref:hypothetical protein n=1 Tax=Croceicoccus sp. YJ47 TaxID=2798724 RepID=UPI0019213616|nr:hypothetical protein [Croceicoccus sp. YJ47]QQN74795.1 hypothetical protein JD971_03465 [Croceicoccus sp. YJ47]